MILIYNDEGGVMWHRIRKPAIIFIMRKTFFFFLSFLLIGLAAVHGGPELSQINGEGKREPSFAEKVFCNPGGYPARELYKLAHEAFSSGDPISARLIALRVFFDGHRSQNLIDLLGAIEIKANRPLLAGEWLRKALCLNIDDSVARKTLIRLPPPPRPIPMDPSKLQEHFAAISAKLPLLLNRLSSPKLHFDSVLDEIARGQFYKALALAEEFEKRYPGTDAISLTALCAFYLGRIKDATQLSDQGLAQDPFNPLLLFVKAMISDVNPDTSAPSRPRVLYDLDKWDEALRMIEQFNQAFPRSAEGYIVKAKILSDRLRPVEAEEALKQASQRDPDHPVAELLRADLLLQAGQAQQADDAVKRAFRRGYNLPSVNLKAGLLALANGQGDDAKTFLEETQTGMPFLDRDAYPLYIKLALAIGANAQARSALDQWSSRVSPQSMYFFMESMYNFKTHQDKQGFDCLRKAMEMNPQQLSMLKILSDLPAINDDPELAYQILERLKMTHGSATPDVQKVRPVTMPSPSPGAAKVMAKQQPKTPPAPPPVAIQTEKCRFTTASDIAQPVADCLRQSAEATLSGVEGMLGRISEAIDVNLVSAAGMGSKTAFYDFSSGVLTISALFADPSTLKAFVSAEKPFLSDEELSGLANSLAQHTLTHEIVHVVIFKLLPKAPTVLGKTFWIQEGLAEILGGGEDVLKSRLVIAQNSIASGETHLMRPDELNCLLADPATQALKREAAFAQAYLMAAFLVKKCANLKEGVDSIMKLLGKMCEGLSLEKALTDCFKINQAAFESGWKEAAYWALRQGIPYQW